MEVLNMCRICLAKDVRMKVIVNTDLEQTYENLTMMTFETKDRPTQVCYICFARLQHTNQLKKSCLQSEELMAHMVTSNVFESDKQEQNPMASRLRATSVLQFNVTDVIQDSPDANVKLEALQASEAMEFEVIQIKMEVVEEPETEGSGEHNAIEPSDDDDDDNEPLINVIEPKIELYEPEQSEPEDPRQRDTPEDVTSSKDDSEGNSNQVTIDINVHTVDGDKRHKCDICGNRFKQKWKLDAHLRVHTGETRNKCVICMKGFKDKWSLDSHFRTHTGEKPYKCSVCTKGFRSKSDLNLHVRRHTGDKPFECVVCKKCFARKIDLNCHIRIHTGEKPFECDLCNKSYAHKSSLNDHIRSHKGEKPYTCNLCSKSFTASTTLTKHIRIHTGEKPYECHICQKTFAVRQYLLDHIIIDHTGERPYECVACDKSYTSKSRLNRHNLLKHNC